MPNYINPEILPPADLGRIFAADMRFALPAEAEADRYRDLHARLGHAGRKGRQGRAAHHLLERLVEIRVAGARGDGIVDDPPAAIDLEAQYCTSLFASLTGGVGIALVAVEPGTQQSAVTRARL